MKAFLLAFCLVAVFATQAQTRYTLEGNLGQSQMYLTFEDDPTDTNELSDIRYFYKNSLKDIVLLGTRIDGVFVFRFKDKDVVVEKFTLVKRNDGTFNGDWVDKNGRSLPVWLKPVDPSILTQTYEWLDYDNWEHKFINLKVPLVRFRKDSTSVFKGSKIDWYTETHGATPMFRIADGLPKRELDAVNAKLEHIHYQLALNQLSCSTEYAYSKGDNMELSIDLGYLDQNLLGFRINCSYYCGGAHPDLWQHGHLIDLHNAHSIELDEILAFDPSVTVETKDGYEKHWAYRDKFFGPKLYSIINSQEHFKKPQPIPNEELSAEEECDYTNVEFWTYPSWNFTAAGIEFVPSFFRAARNCEQPFLVPFKALRPFKNPNFPYRF